MVTGLGKFALRPASRKLPARMRARYDAAQTTADNRKHWSMADALAADAANSPGVRSILRNRARHEVANNSYAKGIVLTLANDVVGTGPRLQLDHPLGDTIEKAFADWAWAANIAGKLHTMRMAKATDGEAFGVLTDNPGLGTAVTLDLTLVEADQVTTPSNMDVDGIEFDVWGNPKQYHVLRSHPGSRTPSLGSGETNIIQADFMLHWFRVDRPGQHRGVPDLTPALPLFAQLREYTLAVIAAANTAADFAVIMKTGAPAGGEAAEVNAMVEMEIVRNMAVFSPEGWEPTQMRAEQPATTYAMFVRAILNEIARCLNMPYNIAACDSSSYNYASGRLDHQTYFKSIDVERAHLARSVLDRILAAFVREAVLIGELPAESLTVLGTADRQWFWEGREHADPAKEANAQLTRLTSGSSSYPREFSKLGVHWRTEMTRQADALGVTLPEYQKLLRQKLFGSPAQAAEDMADQDEKIDRENQAEEAAKEARDAA